MKDQRNRNPGISKYYLKTYHLKTWQIHDDRTVLGNRPVGGSIEETNQLWIGKKTVNDLCEVKAQKQSEAPMSILDLTP